MMATKLGLHCADYLITEAGFATELGGEKFMHLKCAAWNFMPAAAVIVASLRALKHHGTDHSTDQSTLKAISKGLANLDKHIENIMLFNIPVVVALNVFPDDRLEDLQAVEELCRERRVEIAISRVWEEGGKGGIDLAKKVMKAAAAPENMTLLYKRSDSLEMKIETIATKLYGASAVNYSSEAKSQLKRLSSLGFSGLPICMAKTQKSLSDDPKLFGRPKDFTLQVREIRLSAGAGFIVPICGSIMTMPGLPDDPAASHIDIDSNGLISGLF